MCNNNMLRYKEQTVVKMNRPEMEVTTYMVVVILLIFMNVFYR